MEENNTEIYFHVGLGKVASTYLQYNVFPKLSGVFYIQRTKYKKSANIIRHKQATKYLVSREFDRQLETEVKKFSADFPHSKPIILLRRHDNWIASQYRRFVKNGFSGKFNDFFDIYHDHGRWKQKELYFFRKIEILEQYFMHKPLVLFYEDFKERPLELFERIAAYIGADLDNEAINLSPRHKSYNKKQLKVIRNFSKYIPIRISTSSAFLNFIYRVTIRPIKYSILYAALAIPEKMINNEPLIPPEELTQIREFYKDDWAQCIDYARKNNIV